MLVCSHGNCLTLHATIQTIMHRGELKFASYYLYLSSNVASELHSCLVVIVDEVLLCQQSVETDAIGMDCSTASCSMPESQQKDTITQIAAVH